MITSRDKVVLYGAGFAAEKFYHLYENIIIKYIIDKVNNRKFHNIPVYDLKDKIEHLEEEYIIVTVETRCTYEEISSELKQIGLFEYQNFIWFKEYDKKLVVMYGNCHFMLLEAYLNTNPYFVRKYATRLFYIPAGQYPDDNTLHFCDLLLILDIKEKNSMNLPGVDNIISKYGNITNVLRVPNLYGCNLFFPQAEEIDDEMIEKHINANAIISDQRNASVFWMTGFRDKNIEHAYEQGKSISDIKQMILEADVYEAEKIVNDFNNMIQKYQDKESHCDIKIMDYILENYKEKSMFTDPHHPSQDVIKEIGRRILKKLEIEIIENKPLNASIDESEIFIYGCVKKALGLKYENKFIRNIMHHSTLVDRGIDLEEYIAQYLAWHYKD